MQGRQRILTVAFLLARAGLHAQSNPFSDDARQTYALIKPILLRAAEKMPEAYYSFRTVSRFVDVPFPKVTSGSVSWIFA